MFSHGIFPLCVSLCSNVPSLQGYQSYWILEPTLMSLLELIVYVKILSPNNIMSLGTSVYCLNIMNFGDFNSTHKGDLLFYFLVL